MDPAKAKTPTIRKFNPGTFQTDEEVIRQFVVREHELGVVLDVLRGNLDTPSCQHVLLVAPRGRGKTMLLARVAAELRIGSGLSDRLIPVRFMEESQEVLDIADFWLETLFYLSKEVVRLDPDLARELQAVHVDLTGQWRGDTLAERARATVLDASDRVGRKLVLMVENMQTLCADVEEDFGWQLRETLQTEPQIILLGTATSRFKGLDEAHEPFFELFRTIDLEPLDIEACGRLWHMVSGDDVTGRRIRPLQILTGGSPRLLVIVAEFARHRSFGKLMEELVTLVDDHTEYFRGHLDVFPPTERRVYLCVIDLWQPSTTGEIAARARMDVRKVSSLLGRLIERGAVTVQGEGRKREYAAAERLYSIYYKLRRERDEAAVVHNLIRFMAVYYSDGEFAEMSDKLSAEAAISPAIREGLERTKAELPKLDRFFDQMKWPNTDSTIGDDAAKSDQASDQKFQAVKAMLDEGLEQLRGNDFDATVRTLNTAIERFTGSRSPRIQMSLACVMVVKGVVQIQLRDFETALKTFDTVIERMTVIDVPKVQDVISFALIGKIMAQLLNQNIEVALSIYDEVIQRRGVSELPAFHVPQEMVATAMVKKGIDQMEIEDHHVALATFDGVVQRFGDSVNPELQLQVARSMLIMGIAQAELVDSATARTTFEKLARRFHSSTVPEIQLAVALALFYRRANQENLDHTETDIKAYDAAINSIGASEDFHLQVAITVMLIGKGIAQGRLGNTEAEIASYQEVIDRFSTSDMPELQHGVAIALINKGMTQEQLGRHEVAMASYNGVLESFGENDDLQIQIMNAEALIKIGNLQLRLGIPEEAISTYDLLSERVGSGEDTGLMRRIARRLINRGETRSQADKQVATTGILNSVFLRIDNSGGMKLKHLAAQALMNKGDAQLLLAKYEEATATYDTIVERFGNSESNELQSEVLKALVYKGLIQNRTSTKSSLKEVFRTCDELEKRLVKLPNDQAIKIQFKADWIRMMALFKGKRHSDAMGVFRSTYYTFDPDDETMVRWMLGGIASATIFGVPEKEIAQILSTDHRKEEAMKPVVVALRQLAGEQVHAPAELIEVTKDIIQDIAEAKKGDGDSLKRLILGRLSLNSANH